MNQDPIFASIDAFAEQNREAILRDITRLVAVPSVQGEPAPRRAVRPRPAPSAGHGARHCRRTRPGHPQCGGLYRLGRDRPRCRRPEIPGHHHPTATLCPKATAGTPTPTPCACGDGWLLGRGVADDKGPPSLRCMRSNISRTAARACATPCARCWEPTRRPTCTTWITTPSILPSLPSALPPTPSSGLQRREGRFQRRDRLAAPGGRRHRRFCGRRGCQRRARPRPLRRACAGGFAAPGRGAFLPGRRRPDRY